MASKQMHRFWLVPEVVDQVLAELRAVSYNTLPKLAHTARLFHEPVLRHLYGHITHPKELYGLVGNAWCEQDGWLTKGAQWTKDQIARFDLRAKYVIHIDFAPHGMPYAGQSAYYAAWSSMLRSHPTAVLPNLRSVCLAFWNPESYEFVLSLVSPSLKEITAVFAQVRVMQWQDGIAGARPQADGAIRAGSFFRRIAAEGCQLRTLRAWELPFERENYESDLAYMLFQQRELTNMSIAGEILEFREALPALATLPRLRELEILKAGNGQAQSLDALDALQHPNITTPSFSHLEALRVMASGPSVVRLLSAIDGRLANIDLELTSDLDVNIIAQITNRAALFYDSLEQFRLVGPYSLTGSHFPLPWAVFEPLLRCRNVTKLSICLHWWGEVSLQDADINRLARAMPRLQCLRIWTSAQPEEGDGIHRYFPPPRVPFTLSCLASLAVFCPDIRLISLTGLDATGTAFKLPEDRPDVVLQQPVHLGLRAAPITSAQHVALYLQTLFPNAVLLHRFSRTDAGYSENKPFVEPWNIVAALMEYHRAALSVERGLVAPEDAFNREASPLSDVVGKSWIAGLPPLM